jgi:flagellar hook assembly protein FlgD
MSVTINVITGNDDNHLSANGWGIRSVYPNPFHPNTNIKFSLDKDNQPIEICIYNTKGQKVASLLKSTPKAGMHSLTWNGTDDYGKQVSSGVYYLSMSSAKQSQKVKILLMK